ncbi:MAG: hypothetical protein N2378_11825 [Chloroflexaceae bacterium]|nr:hypothetical protein [Chloroflexaceae bacterium]
MATVKTPYEHIVLNEEQVAFIAGTTMKVRELFAEGYAYGWSAEALQVEHPYSSPGRISSALAYYFDHQDALDADLQARAACAQEVRQGQTPTGSGQR